MPPSPGCVMAPPDASRATDRVRVHALLLARDEAHNLADCVHSLQHVADRVTVFDTGSTDHSADVARELGCAWEPLPWRDDFAAARNEALQRLDGDWVLVIDADERLDREACTKIHASLHTATPDDVVFSLEQRTYTDEVEALGYVGLSATEIARRGVAGYVPQPQPRLFRLGRGLRYEGRVCERLVGASESALPVLAPSLGVLHHWRDTQTLARRRQRSALRLRLALRAVLGREAADAWATLGALLNEQRKWSAALPYLRAAEEAMGSSPGLDLQIGVAQLYLGLVDGAVESLRRAWQALPEHPELAGWLARALVRSGRRAHFDDAEALLERAMEQAPELEHVVIQRAVLHRHLAQFDEARALLQTVLERNPVHALALKELGVVALLQERVDEAEEHLRQATRLRSNDAEAWNNLGCALERRGSWREALGAFERAAALESGNEAYLRNRCIAQAACSQWRAMCRSAQEALLASEDPLALLVRLRETCLDAGWLRALRKLEAWAVREGWLRPDACIVSPDARIETAP